MKTNLIYGCLSLMVPAAMLSGFCAPAASAEPRIGSYTCEVSTRMGTGADSQADAGVHLAGQGLATCKNGEGFQFDLPIRVRMLIAPKAHRVVSLGDTNISASTTGPFVIARSFDELYDSFEPVASASALSDPQTKKVLLRGKARGLVIEFKMNSSAPDLENSNVQTLTLAADDTAPNLTR